MISACEITPGTIAHNVATMAHNGSNWTLHEDDPMGQEHYREFSDFLLAALDASLRTLCTRALSIREKALGPEHPDVASPFVSASSGRKVRGPLGRDDGKFDEAEPLYTRAISIKEKSIGHEHPVWRWRTARGMPPSG